MRWANMTCRAHWLSILSDEDCRKYEATARSQNLNRQSNDSIDRSSYFAPAGYNRSSTELEL
jgi:hypothetical protein